MIKMQILPDYCFKNDLVIFNNIARYGNDEAIK